MFEFKQLVLVSRSNKDKQQLFAFADRANIGINMMYVF